MTKAPGRKASRLPLADASERAVRRSERPSRALRGLRKGGAPRSGLRPLTGASTASRCQCGGEGCEARSRDRSRQPRNRSASVSRWPIPTPGGGHAACRQTGRHARRVNDASQPQRAQARRRGRARGRHWPCRRCGRSALPMDGAAKPGVGGGHVPRPIAGRPERRAVLRRAGVMYPGDGAVRAPEWRAATGDGNRGLNLGAQVARVSARRRAQVYITPNSRMQRLRKAERPTATTERPGLPSVAFAIGQQRA